MQATFLVRINIVDVTTLADEAADIEHDLVNAGHDVVSVEPWARPSTATASVIPLVEGLQPPPTI
jgi:hypothetical protein